MNPFKLCLGPIAYWMALRINSQSPNPFLSLVISSKAPGYGFTSTHGKDGETAIDAHAAMIDALDTRGRGHRR